LSFLFNLDDSQNVMLLAASGRRLLLGRWPVEPIKEDSNLT